MSAARPTLAGAVADARAEFSAAGLPDAAIEARLLIGGLLGLTSTEVFANGDRVLGDHDMVRIRDAVARRLKREPVHRILGLREFYGMDLVLSAETLEPRPDTEILVDTMLEPLRRIVSRKGSARVLDLGTGTGAIILALLAEVPETTGTASDISDDALSTTRKNAERLGLSGRLETVKSHWFDAIAGSFDIIVSNPPYIRSDVIPELDPEVRNFDPPAALDGGPDGLDAYRSIARGAGTFLDKDGFLGVEIGFDQKNSVTEIFQTAGFIFAQARRDYGNNDRVLVFAGNGL
jgi:release factor glutamine methyltransferase